MRPEGMDAPKSSSEGFRVDAVDDAGRLVEVQSGPLGPLAGETAAVAAGPSHADRQAGRAQAAGRAEVAARWAGSSRRGAARSEARSSTFSTT